MKGAMIAALICILLAEVEQIHSLGDQKMHRVKDRLDDSCEG